MPRVLLLTLGVVLASALSFAAWAADEGAHAAHGTVKSVNAAAGTVTIDHEDIPGLMMGMTMTFSVPEPEVLRGVEPGQVIDFRVRKDGDRYIVTEIRPAAAGASPGGHEKMNHGMMRGGCCRGSMSMALGRHAPPCHQSATQVPSEAASS